MTRQTERSSSEALAARCKREGQSERMTRSSAEHVVSSRGATTRPLLLGHRGARPLSRLEVEHASWGDSAREHARPPLNMRSPTAVTDLSLTFASRAMSGWCFAMMPGWAAARLLRRRTTASARECDEATSLPGRCARDVWRSRLSGHRDKGFGRRRVDPASAAEE